MQSRRFAHSRLRAAGAVLLASSSLLLNCETTKKVTTTTVETTKKVARSTGEVARKTTKKTTAQSRKITEKFARYLREKDVWGKFHDLGDHDPAAVLGVLRRKRTEQRKAPDKKGPTQRLPEPPDRSDYRWPLEAGLVSSEFGPRKGRSHDGIDIAAETGEPIYAVRDGEVIYSGNGLRGYGNVVILQHDTKVTTLYAHASKLHVKVGKLVKPTDRIAQVGNTGRSTGPHLHFEIREGDNARNPRSRLPKSRF